MTNDDLVRDWRSLAVKVGDHEPIPFKDRYMLCYGYQEQYGGVCFDVGGEQGAEMHSFRVEGDDLISVNPLNPQESQVIGKIVKL